MNHPRFLLTLFLAFTVSMVFGQWDNVDDRSSGFSITQADEFTGEYAKYPTRPLLVCWQGISGYGSRTEVNVTIVETTYGYYGIPADQLFKDLMLQLAVEGKLKKYKHLDNPKRERIELLSFMYIRDGFIYSSDSTPQRE